MPPQEISTQMTLLRWPLNDHDDLWEAMKDLTQDHGYINAAVTVTPAGYTLTVNLNNALGQIVEGRVGLILVLLGGVLEAITHEEYNSRGYGS